eukprot:8106208-Pyramimonas_sp.AAC.1
MSSALYFRALAQRGETFAWPGGVGFSRQNLTHQYYTASLNMQDSSAMGALSQGGLDAMGDADFEAALSNADPAPAGRLAAALAAPGCHLLPPAAP